LRRASKGEGVYAAAVFRGPATSAFTRVSTRYGRAPQDDVGEQTIPRLIDSFNDMLVRLVDGLADPARRRRAALAFCLAYGALWFIYGVIAKSSQDLNADMGEMIVWTRELALGYPKHPPLLAYVLWGWFKIFPLADWAYILLAVVTVSIGIFLAIELSAEWLAKEKLAAVPFLLAVIPFYNFLGLKFDQNSALIPLWALAMWAMLRALDTRHPGWAALAGTAAAAALLVKYWSVFLIAALALAAFMHPKRRDYFRSAAPWVTAGVFLVAVAPHVVWLIRENFPPITWVATRRVATSFGGTLASMLEALGGTFAYAAIAIALILIFVRPSPGALRDGLLPQGERRVAANLFYVPLVLPVVPALIKNINLLSLWNTPALNLLPVMLLGSPLVTVPRVVVLRIASVVTVLTLLFVLASPFVAFALLKRGVENDAAYARLLMEATEREWRKDTGKPLKLIGGPFTLVSTASFYGKDRPSTYAHFSNYLSPWVDDARIARDGMAIMCFDTELCRHYMGEIAARYGGASHQTDVTLTRRWLGFENAPAKFIIAIVPPR
jgi:4-amino-4-deoxy-L-arabinose transferase-like glycosyltransferase